MTTRDPGASDVLTCGATDRPRSAAFLASNPHVNIEIITGDTGRRDRGEILDDLRDGTLDAVAAPRVLDEGVDVPNANLGLVVSASRTRRQMIQRMGRILRRKPLGSGARFVIIFAADTLEDPRFSEDRDGFLEEIESIAESSRIFRPSEFDELATFLDYTGPAVVIDPETVGDFVTPDLPPDEITEWTAEAQPYLEMVSPELPEVRQPRQVREKPRLSTGEHPVSLQAVGKEWALRCTGCGTMSEPRVYKWQAMDDKVECTCVR